MKTLQPPGAILLLPPGGKDDMQRTKIESLKGNIRGLEAQVRDLKQDLVNERFAHKRTLNMWRDMIIKVENAQDALKGEG